GCKTGAGRDRTQGAWRLTKLAHVAVALDGVRHPLAIGWKISISNIGRPRIDHVRRRVYVFGVPRAERDSVAPFDVLGKRILVPGDGAGTRTGACKRDRRNDLADFHDVYLFLLAGGSEAWSALIRCP